MVSAIDYAKRSLVALLKALAKKYGLVITLSRESSEAVLRTAVRKVSLKAHPDRSGSDEDQKLLNASRDAWQEAVAQASGKRGAPPKNATPKPDTQVVAKTTVRRADHEPGFRVQSVGVLLTYQKFPDVGVWPRFLDFVKQLLSPRGVRHWCATLETNDDGTYHLHLMLQFNKKEERCAQDFAFEGVRPNARPNDLLGDGWGGRNYQQSLDRGFFYVWADKVGTARDGTGKLCVAGNYEPSWTHAKLTYTVSGRWLDSLFKAYKLSEEGYDEYVHLSRDGVCYRKRNLEACRERAQEKQTAREVEERIKRIRSNPALYQPFKSVAEATCFLELFKHDAFRYPLLLVHAPSYTGKTEWANSLFSKPFELKVGSLTHFPEAMRRFSRDKFDGLVLDDVRDLSFLSEHQDKLQGKYTGPVEFASTAGGTCAYWRDLFKVPVVVTVNNDTKNLRFLAPGAHDFLGKRENVHYLHFAGRPGEVAPTTVWTPP